MDASQMSVYSSPKHEWNSKGVQFQKSSIKSRIIISATWRRGGGSVLNY